MKFGHVNQEEIDTLTFTLPEDHKISREILNGIDYKPSFFVGCGKWGIPEWVGPLYPEGTRQKDFLSAYLTKFNSIELNGTFYRLSRSSIESWAEQAGASDFLYCPKWSQRISHFKRLSDVEENTNYFMESVALLGKNLGATFLTLPPNFGPKYIDRVFEFIRLLPKNYPALLEFRHQDWFIEPVFSEVMSALKERGIGAVITDVALRRDALHMCLTSPTLFVRFNGYGLHPSDFKRLDDWIDRLVTWSDKGLKKVFFFMHQENEAHTIALCDYFIKNINKKLSTNLLPLDLPSDYYKV
ncbi:MAG: DUF72 domain-containing protein [Saprospiraceae bacterium]|nr:DUF72 domain-containing protein [Saprospiraceae bacterium]